MGSQSWREWLADPGRTGTSPPGVIERAIGLATGRAPATVERLLHGEVNEVYDVTTDTVERVVVRIGRRHPSLFPAERWAIEAAATMGAAVPEVLLVDEIQTANETLGVCVQRHAGGWPLQQVALAAGSPDGFEATVRAAGRHLALVHEVETDGFGKLDSRGRATDSGWVDFLTMPAREPHWYRPAVAAANYDGDRFDEALRALEKHGSVYSGTPRLIHADFGAKHVLADGDLRALIDFEVCRGGDPAYDVAAWDIYFHNTLRTEWLLEGYTEVASLDDDFDLRMRLCRILLAIRLLGHSTQGFTGFVPLATKTIDRELASLS